MKRKELMGNKVIKAMSIGLATMVTVTSTPVAVLAEASEAGDSVSTDVTNNASSSSEESLSQSVKDADTALEDVNDKAETVNDSIDTVKKDVENITKAEESAAASESTEDTTKTQAIVNASNAVSEEAGKVNDQIEKTNESLNDVKTYDAAKNDVAASVEEKADNATTKSEETASYMADASDKADSLVNDINNASTADEANKAYADLNTLTEEAAAKLTEANEELAKIEADYNKAKEDLVSAKEAYDKAVNASSDAAANLKKNVEALEIKTKSLESSVKAAKKEVESSNSSALAIINAQTKVNNGGGYRAADNLFKAIIENYYIKNVVPEATDIKVSDWTWYAYDSDYNYNYCKVTYKVGDEERTEYYNYKYEEGNSKSLEIFKKSETEVGAGNYIAENYSDKTTNKADTKEAKAAAKSGVYTYTENGKTKYITGEELKTISESKITQNSKYINNTPEFKADGNADFTAFLEGDTEAARKVKAAKDNADKIDAWTTVDTYFSTIVVNYYVPKIDENATDITVKGWSKYGYADYNYCEVTYKVGNEEKTLYLNYKADKLNSNSIVIFEKTEDEIGAAKYIKEKCTNKETNEVDKTALDKEAKSGVYTYTVNGQTRYITGLEKAELEKNKVEVVQNVTYINKASEFVQSKNTEFNTFVNDANTIISNYTKLYNDTKTAKENIANEAKSVEGLVAKVAELGSQDGMSFEEAIRALDAKLAKAKEKQQSASEKFESIKDKRDKAQNDLNDVIRKIESESSESSDASESSASESGSGETGSMFGLVSYPSGVTPTVPAAGVAGVRVENQGKPAGKLTPVAEAAKIDKEASNVTKKAENKKEDITETTNAEDEVVTIKENEIPLSAMPSESEKSGMNYWWLLTVSLLGPAGYALYRKIGKKEEEA